MIGPIVERPRSLADLIGAMFVRRSKPAKTSAPPKAKPRSAGSVYAMAAKAQIDALRMQREAYRALENNAIGIPHCGDQNDVRTDR